jgi:hypothetical protein
MAAGVADHIGTCDEIVALLDSWWESLTVLGPQV